MNWQHGRLKLFLRDGVVPKYVVYLDGDVENDDFANLKVVASQREVRAHYQPATVCRQTFVIDRAREKFSYDRSSDEVRMAETGVPAPTYLNSKGYRCVYIGTFAGKRVEWALAKLKIVLAGEPWYQRALGTWRQRRRAPKRIKRRDGDKTNDAWENLDPAY
jgi:hypothetical protein